MLEYRGYGHSRGWPTGANIVSDAAELAEYVMKRENISANELLPVGISLGTGPAASVAARFYTRSLLLTTPYASLKRVAGSRRIVRWFVPLMWNEIDTSQYVSSLDDTCVVAQHGSNDEIIAFDNSQVLQAAYRGSSGFRLLVARGASHNQAFCNLQSDTERELRACGIELAAAVP